MKVTPDDYGRRCQFDHFCKLVLYHEAVDYFRERKRQRGWETSFEMLPLSELDTLPFLTVRLPSQQRIAVAGRCDFIQRILPENIVKDLQNPIKAQHLIRPPHRKSIQTISFPQPVLSMCSSSLPIAFDLRLLTLHPRLRLPSTVA